MKPTTSTLITVSIAVLTCLIQPEWPLWRTAIVAGLLAAVVGAFYDRLEEIRK